MDEHSSQVNKWRTVLETFCGLLTGVPIGFILYYFVVMTYAEVLQFALLLLVIPVVAVFHISGLAEGALEAQMNFGDANLLLLAGIAVVAEAYFYRAMIRRGYRVFAWVQLPLALTASLWLFSLSLLHHKPLLPFYDQ